ncbi:MAG TPA: enolase C-terminal domain-like protein [Pirellulales bacterium]|jgi:glucarate dehydratase|nr:enolase C-terminal domain-like protein [Pirellulales bacterium]
MFSRRQWIAAQGSAFVAAAAAGAAGQGISPQPSALTITDLKVTPIALPDPPLLAASGCHGPYFLRNIVEVTTNAGIVGIGETHGGQRVTEALVKSREIVVGQNAFAYRRFSQPLSAISDSAYAGIELACLDACGKATGRRVCELLGGPVREEVEFAAYLFYRYAADRAELLADPRIVDDRGRGQRALDTWGDVRTAQAMATLAAGFRERWGFRVFKLKAGVLSPEVESATMHALAERLGKACLLRIDPNARWKTETAIRVGRELKALPLEYYEDPVAGQEAMAEVRRATALAMSTNMCVTSFRHLPDAFRLEPIDVLLCDHHYFGGMAGCLALGPAADGVGWKLSQHSNNHAGITMAAMIHLAAALPQLTLASDTHYPWLPEDADIIGAKLAIRDGRMQLPTKPGLGVELDRDRLGAAHDVYRRSGMRERDDAGTMKLVEPGWKRDLL